MRVNCRGKHGSSGSSRRHMSDTGCRRTDNRMPWSASGVSHSTSSRRRPEAGFAFPSSIPPSQLRILGSETMRPALVCSVLLASTCLLTSTALAQRGGPPQPPPPRAQAAFDITGYWMSLVSEDWRYRITTPPKGDVAGVPLNGAGRQAAQAWDPAKDEAAGESCKAYGAAGLMRMPGRLHVTWASDDTLSIEADAGTQTRTIAFRG